MTNPLFDLAPLFKVLSEELVILPATGGAVEELQHPDQDEIEDVLIDQEGKEITAFAEEPEPDPSNIYRPTPPLPRRERHLFRFFLDGSIRTYFLGTGIEGNRSFPIEMSQIGAAVVRREEDGSLGVLTHVHKVLLLLPKQSQGVSDTLWSRIQSTPKPDFVEIVDFTIPDSLSESKRDPRDKAGAKARSAMHKLEISLIKSTDEARNDEQWLIIDGSVKFVEDDIWRSWSGKEPCVIGVAKSFRKDPVFHFGHKRPRRKDITSLLAGLPHAHRTVAFSAYEGRVAFWYVRLREQKEVDYPLMGVVKVEIPRPDRTPVPSELADLISRALVAERNVTPYGAERRWHCSLYPIYVAEQVIKSKFYSREVLMSCIRWLKPAIGGTP